MLSWFHSFRFRLFGLVGVALLPALIVIFHSGLQERRHAADDAQANLRRLVILAAREQEQKTMAARHLLMGLSQVPAIRRQEPQVCNAFFAQLLRSKPSLFINLGAIDRDGNIFASAVPMAGPLNTSHLQYFQKAQKTKDFSVGNLQFGRIVLKPVLIFAYPLLDAAGVVETVIYASVSLDWLNDLAAKARMPQNSVLVIIDEQGTIMAKNTDPEKWAGKSLPPEGIFSLIRQQGEGVAEAVGMDGVPRLYAFTSMGDDPLIGYVYAGIPLSEVYGAASQALVRNLAGLGIALGLSLSLAWVFSRRWLLRPVETLAGTAAQLAAGDLRARTSLARGPEEILRLGRAFDHMAASLQQHEAERHQAEEALRQSEAHLQEAQRIAHMGSWSMKLKGNTVEWSEEMYRIYEVIKEEYPHTVDSLLQLLHPDDRPLLKIWIEQAMANLKPPELDFRIILSDGTIRYIRGAGDLIFDQTGKPERLAGTAQDITERKRTEEALKESEHKYRELVENANSIILRWNKEGKITFLNEFGQKFFGYTEDEIIGRHVTETIVPPIESTGRQLQPLMDEICADPKKFEYNINENIRSNGERVWIAWTNKTILNSQGQLVEILSIGSDITKRKQAEEALRQEKDLSDHIINSLPGIFYLYDEQRRFIRVNQRFEEVTGYSAQEIANLSPLDFFEGPDRDLLAQRIQQVFTEGQGEAEAFFVTKNGARIPYYFTGLRTTVDGKPHLLGVGIDITALKEAQEALIRRTEELAALNDLAQRVGAGLSLEEVADAALDQALSPAQPDLAVLYLREDNHLVLQKAQPNIDLLSSQEAQLRMGKCLCGLAFQEGKPIYSPDIHADPRCTLTPCKEEGMQSFAALPLLSGEWVLGVLGLAWAERLELETRAKFLETLAGEVAMGLHNALLFRELQQHARKLESRVQERTAQLQAANKELEAFAYSISHDLRAPLRAVSGFAQIIARRHRAALNDEGRHYVDNIVLAGERMGHLIDDLLSYSRLGRKAMTRQPLALGKVVSQVLDDLADRMTAAGAVVSVPEDLPIIPGDPTLLQQIFTNLLENALIYQRHDVVPNIRVSWSIEDDQIILKVADNGIGIGLEYQEKIFNVFQRLHSDDEYPGTGIGLAIVKKAVEMLGGRVWVESKAGQGSIFYLKLPKD